MPSVPVTPYFEFDPALLPPGPEGPPGPTGPQGAGFSPNAIGPDSGRSEHDAAVAGFSYLSTDLAQVFFKLSATSGDWSAPVAFSGSSGPAGVVLQRRPQVIIPPYADPMVWPSFAAPYNEWQAITGLSQTITRTDPNSKIRIQFSVNLGQAASPALVNFTQFTVFRNGVNITRPGFASEMAIRAPDGQNDALFPSSCTVIDSGGGTGQLTYQGMIKVNHSTSYLGRRGVDLLFQLPGATLDVSEELHS